MYDGNFIFFYVKMRIHGLMVGVYCATVRMLRIVRLPAVLPLTTMAIWLVIILWSDNREVPFLFSFRILGSSRSEFYSENTFRWDSRESLRNRSRIVELSLLMREQLTKKLMDRRSTPVDSTATISRRAPSSAERNFREDARTDRNLVEGLWEALTPL